MPDLVLRVTQETLRLEYPHLGEVKQYPNTVVYNKDTLQIEDFFVSEAELKTRLGKNWSAFRQVGGLGRAFDPHPQGPVFDFPVLAGLLEKARQHIFPKRPFGKRALPWNRIDLALNYGDFDRLPLGRQRELEYYLYDFQHIHRLALNGKDITLAPSLRWQQWLVGFVLRGLLPVLCLYGGLMKTVQVWEQGPWPALGWLLGGLVGAVILYILGTAAWLWFYRPRLPHGYLRYQLRSRSNWLRGLNRWLAGKLLD
jgi:hypothetical protein